MTDSPNSPEFNPSHLPAPLPQTTALLHRTQTALAVLRDVVQESIQTVWRKSTEVFTPTFV